MLNSDILGQRSTERLEVTLDHGGVDSREGQSQGPLASFAAVPTVWRNLAEYS